MVLSVLALLGIQESIRLRVFILSGNCPQTLARVPAQSIPKWVFHDPERRAPPRPESSRAETAPTPTPTTSTVLPVPSSQLRRQPGTRQDGRPAGAIPRKWYCWVRSLVLPVMKDDNA